MCGITAYWQKDGLSPSDRRTLARMTMEIRHRGSDNAGFHFKGPIGLGARRLSIIDLPAGNQPIYNESRTVSVIFNGEIYNYRELRKNLLDLGHHFNAESASEVVGAGAPLIEERLGRNGVFDTRSVREVVAGCRIGKIEYVRAFFRPLMFLSWSERFGVCM